MLDLKASEELLEGRLKELTARVEDIEGQLGASGDDDYEEMAAESANDETLEGVLRAAKDELNQIVLALKRVKSGAYGKCASCGMEIHEARLKAVPYASRCINCA